MQVLRTEFRPLQPSLELFLVFSLIYTVLMWLPFLFLVQYLAQKATLFIRVAAT